MSPAPFPHVTSTTSTRYRRTIFDHHRLSESWHIHYNFIFKRNRTFTLKERNFAAGHGERRRTAPHRIPAADEALDVPPHGGLWASLRLPGWALGLWRHARQASAASRLTAASWITSPGPLSADTRLLGIAFLEHQLSLGSLDRRGRRARRRILQQWSRSQPSSQQAVAAFRPDLRFGGGLTMSRHYRQT